jgi:hypothetical protein
MKIMGQTIATIIYLIIALAVIATVGSLILSVIGLLFGLIPFLIKLAIFGGLIYLAWILIRKLAQTAAD